MFVFTTRSLPCPEGADVRFDAGLLDEIRLTVAPVALDGGAPLLPRTIRAQHLVLTGARQAGAFAELTYGVRR